MKTATLPARRVKPPKACRALRRAVNPPRLQIKNVLVPLDFSPASHRAIRCALPWLNRYGAKLHLIHVLAPDSPFSAVADLPMVVPEVEIGRRVRRDLSKAVQRCGIRTEAAHLHLRRGTPFAQIC